MLAPRVKPKNSLLPYQRVKTVEVKKSGGKLKRLKIEKAITELALALQSDQKEFEPSLFQLESFSDVQRYIKSLPSENYLPTEVFLKDQRTDVEKAERFNRYLQSVFSSEKAKRSKA